MVKHPRILFIGPISPPATGPGIKNKLLVDQLEEEGVSLQKMNTLELRNSFFNKWLIALKKMWESDTVIISVSKKGRFLISFLFFLKSWFRKTDIYLFPAGGSMDEELKDLPAFIMKFYKREFANYKKIYPENKELSRGLQKMGFDNLSLFPNPRKQDSYKWSYCDRDTVKIIFLSSIRKRKGPIILVDSISSLREEGYKIQLDFYGRVFDEFKSEFFTSIEGKDFVNYKGMAKPEEVQGIISKYDIFCLPTMFDEGLPGVMVEALMVGIPFIATKFRASDEYLSHEENAMLVERGSVKELSKAIKEVIENPTLAKKLANNFHRLSEKFDITKLIKIVLEDIEVK